MDRDVAVAKIATIRRCLDRIAAQTEATEGRLDTLDSQDIVAMNVQRAAQAAIDLAATWCAGLGLAPSQTLKGHFEALGKTGVLDATRVRRLSAMVGFRNVPCTNTRRLTPISCGLSRRMMWSISPRLPIWPQPRSSLPARDLTGRRRGNGIRATPSRAGRGAGPPTARPA